MDKTDRKRAPKNRTLSLSAEEYEALASQLLVPQAKLEVSDFAGKIIWDDFFHVVELLPDRFVDLLILDPPYNLDKDFNGISFSKRSNEDYEAYLESWFPKLLRLLKPHATVYLCGDWRCSSADHRLMSQYLKVQNRITWQREKGRGAASNWKNCCEDIWFGTLDDDYYFNAEAVKMRRKVMAPYRQEGKPKDWEETEEGNYRMTFPSNFWDDISIPYWSMAENTDHPTQKPEKLLAKLILASSRAGDFVFDPFLGSGTTAVVAKKLGRKFSGIEINQEYCCWGEKRLERAELQPEIQGYVDGVFWERNSRSGQKRKAPLPPLQEPS